MSSPTQVLPSTNLTEKAPGLAFAPTGFGDVAVFAGPCAAGPYEPRNIGASNLDLLKSTYKCGPAMKEAAYAMSKVAKAIVMLRLPRVAVAGAVHDLAVSRDPSSDFTYTTSGTITDGADVVIGFPNGGTTGVSGIRYTVSTDGGATVGAEQALGTGTTITVRGRTVALGSGKVITTGDEITWWQTPPSGSILTQTETKDAGSTSSLALSGTPEDAYEIAFEVAVGCTVGQSGGRYRYTLDRGSPSPIWTSSAAIPTANAATKGSLTSAAGSFPVALAAGDTFVGKVDQQSVADTLTIAATAASNTGAAATYAAVTAGHTLTLTLAGRQFVVVFTGSEATQAAFHATINAVIAGFGLATNSSGQTKISTAQKGSGATGAIDAADADVLASLGLSVAAFTAGTGNVADVAAVTAAELAALLTATFTGGTAGSTATAIGTDRVKWETDTAGASPKGVQFTSGSGVAKVNGFDTSEHNGSATGTVQITLYDGAEDSGVRVTLAAGDLTAYDKVEADCSEPAYDAAGVAAAINGTGNSDGLVNWHGGSWAWPRFVGPISEATAESVASIISGLDSVKLPSWGLADARDRVAGESIASYQARVAAEFAPYTSTHLGITGGKVRLTCPITGRRNRRSNVLMALPRAMGLPEQVDWGRFDLGPVEGVSITNADGVLVEVDSEADSTLNSIGIITARRWRGYSGVYPTKACLCGPDGDIQRIPLRRVMNVAKKLYQQILQMPICKEFRVLKQDVPKWGSKKGDIYPPDLKGMNTEAQRIFTEGLVSAPGGAKVSGFEFAFNATPVSLGGGAYRLTSKLKLLSLIYVDEADGEVQWVSDLLSGDTLATVTEV